MKRRLSAERLAYGFALALAAFAFCTALAFPHPQGAPSGPGTCPLLLSATLAALALAGLFLPARNGASANVPAQEPLDLHRLLALAGLTTAYLLALPILGFISATALFTALVLGVLGFRQPVQALAAGFVFAFALYGVFALLMNVALPKGWID